MPLKLTCPHCRQSNKLQEPLPLPGSTVYCTHCKAPLTLTYPADVIDDLKRRGKQFVPTHPPAPSRKTPSASVPKAKLPSAPATPTPVPRARIDLKSTAEALEPCAATPKPTPRARSPRKGPTSEPPTEMILGGREKENDAEENTFLGEERQASSSLIEFGDRTIPSARSPYGGLPNNAHEPESARKLANRTPGGTPTPGDTAERKRPKVGLKNTDHTGLKIKRTSKKPPKRSWLRRLLGVFSIFFILLLCIGAFGGGGGYWYFSQDLPSTEALQAYQPPTVTVVFDQHGKILGEIYEERRYVVPLDKIPDHVKNAFISAEDANFWEHGGVDYFGIVRAVLRNAWVGRKAQGASTITQQVTRNFLLTNEKTMIRKIKEVLLAWRIEETYSKEHILFLYLNEIYLGSSAYGVEAAAQVYFGKHVEQLTVAEAALLAGLPQRPSEYSPHRHFTSAKSRQGYVLEQMVKNGYLTQAEADQAAKEEVVVVERTNEFLEQAPHFTEYARRYLVERYGEKRVLKEGLQVTTTCDLDLQKHAQQLLIDHVTDIDQQIGFRRDGLIHLSSEPEIRARLDTQEATMKQQWAREQDPAGRVPEPELSILTPDTRVEAVILEVKPTWARVGIGKHEALMPLAWANWVYAPDPRRSWRSRDARDLTEPADIDGDGKKDGPILQKGDVVQVEIGTLNSTHASVAKVFAETPGATKSLVGVKLIQDAMLEASLLSYDLDSGAVRAMVGGADFRRSQLNRAIQSRRQVGSTFKPFVYAAAIDSRQITAASLVADAPLAFATGQNFTWKPSNYSNDYIGNITLRKALALSKNTCTVRIIDSIDPNMSNDLVYRFSKHLGLGGSVLANPDEYAQLTPDTDHLCPWVEGKRACDYSIALGSASLSMDEMLRAYSAFATGGKLVEPYFIEEVRDRNGNILEKHTPPEPIQAIDSGVASITNWLLQSVVHEGTAAAANRLGITVAGKTGTSNDEKDAWFIGFTPHVITGVWIGYDQPQTLGPSATGGKVALPLWMKYMEKAAPKQKNVEPFRMVGDLEWANIDEATGRRVTSGGRSYPFLAGTAPSGSGVAAGQATIEDLSTEM